MTCTKKTELNNNIYTIASIALWCIYVFIFKAKFTIFGSLVITYSLLAMWMSVNTQIAIEVKKWKHDDDAYIELMGACSLPVVTFLFIAMEGHNSILVGIVVVCTILSALYYAASVRFNLKDVSRGDNFKAKVKAISMYRARSFLVVCIAFCIVAPMLARPVIRSTNKEIILWSNERTISANYDKLGILIDEEEVKKKTFEEKKELFEMIVDVESNYLGIPYKIEIKPQKLDDTVAASFNQEEYLIKVNMDYLSRCTGEELIDTAAHEVRHAYQYEIVKLYDKLKKRHDKESAVLLSDIIAKAPIYSKEFASYKNSGEKYYRQECEEDARAYAFESYEAWRAVLLSNNKDGDNSDE